MTTKSYAFTLAFLIIALISVAGAGSFAVSLEQQHKIDIAQRIRNHELEIAKLRRENEELSVKIAKEENPQNLNRRASTRLIQPKIGAVVWAYEHFDGGRVEYPTKKGYLSFKNPTRTSNKLAER